jgi:hypothetical protein
VSLHYEHSSTDVLSKYEQHGVMPVHRTHPFVLLQTEFKQMVCGSA